VGGRCASLLIKLAVGAVAVAIFLILLGLWWDERFVRSYQEQERMTIRPEPRFCPRRGSAQGLTADECQERSNVPIGRLDETGGGSARARR
jgi:hypothetical protein